MKRLFWLFILPFFALTFAQAQDIPVEKKERNTYSFSVPDFVVVQDFEFVSAVTTAKPDEYIINVRALTANKETDVNLYGKLLFEINGQQKLVDFKAGLGNTIVTIKGTRDITMRAVDTDITRKGTIKNPFPWDKIIGSLVVLALLAFVILRRRKKNRNTNK
jgi:hypothetical protein